MRRRLLTLALLSACTGPTPKDAAVADDSADSELTPDDSAAVDDSGDPQLVPFTLRLFGDGERLGGVLVTDQHGAVHEADAQAELTLSVPPDEPLRLEHQPSGYHRNLFLLHSPATGGVWELATSSREKLALLLESVASPQDPALGLLAVSVYLEQVGVPYVGAQLSLDDHSGELLLPTRSQGFIHHDTLTEDSLGLLLFTNAQPGERDLQLTLPGDARCGLAPGEGVIPPATVLPDGHTVMTVLCRESD